MPFFFIVPVWLLCVLIGVLLCLFKRSRFLSLYLVLSSTGGTIVSLTLSTFLLWIAPKLFSKEHTWDGVILVAAYLASIAVGGVVGTAAGFIAAGKINQRLRWTRAC
jgi:hypothetical protein